jgi:hypothetical protein
MARRRGDAMSLVQEHEQRWRDEDANKVGFGKAVFDRALSADRNTEHKIGLGNGSGMGGGFSTYRTDTDRRPARPVIRPNDGPSPDREARAAALLASLEKPVRVFPAQDERLTLVLKALLNGAMNNKALAAATNLRPGNTADITTAAYAKGLVDRERVQGPQYSEVLIRLTEAGESAARGGKA